MTLPSGEPRYQAVWHKYGKKKDIDRPVDDVH